MKVYKWMYVVIKLRSLEGPVVATLYIRSLTSGQRTIFGSRQYMEFPPSQYARRVFQAILAHPRPA